MTKEQIEKAGWHHADNNICENCRESRFYAFCKGAEFRQPEINELLMILTNVVSDLAAFSDCPDIDRCFWKYDKLLNEFLDKKK